MKLLLCLNCSDVTKLAMTHRECACGQSGGKYINDIDGRYYGNAMLLGFHNGSLSLALNEQCREGDSMEVFTEGYYKGQPKGREFLAFIIPQFASSVKYYITKEEYDAEN